MNVKGLLGFNLVGDYVFDHDAQHFGRSAAATSVVCVLGFDVEVKTLEKNCNREGDASSCNGSGRTVDAISARIRYPRTASH
ncbi:hypothetical protein P3T76_012216 [Phytophthora citrophthora]|uniref:Uncharacterized protein n=1 Tax=Phytophthora citrophthora TaxID=4793 RepID=A0AAD9G5J0_9STRA|nr:hypothetical protein P3T76_012216 [Phytophthora citrophthora]